MLSRPEPSSPEQYLEVYLEQKLLEAISEQRRVLGLSTKEDSGFVVSFNENNETKINDILFKQLEGIFPKGSPNEVELTVSWGEGNDLDANIHFKGGPEEILAVIKQKDPEVLGRALSKWGKGDSITFREESPEEALNHHPEKYFPDEAFNVPAASVGSGMPNLDIFSDHEAMHDANKGFRHREQQRGDNREQGGAAAKK